MRVLFGGREQGPEEGHTFRLEVTSRMSSRVEETGKPPTPYTDADWFGPPLVLEVRAWNLHDALRLAAEQPLAEWRHDGQRLGDEPEEVTP